MASFTPKAGTYTRRVYSRPFIAGGADSFDIPRGDDIATIIIEITGTVQLTTAATTVAEFGAAMLLNNAQLAADGSKRFQYRTGIMSAVGNFELGLAREQTNPGTGIATHNVSVQHIIDMASYGGPRPKDSALHTSQPYMSLLNLNVFYNQVTAMWSTFGAGVLGTVALTTNVYVEYYQEKSPADLTEGRWIRRVSPFELKSTAANSQLQLQLPGGTYLRGIKWNSFDLATASPTSAQRINAVRVRNGTDIRRELLTVPFIRGQNRREFLTGAYLDTYSQLAYLDMLSQDGSLTDLWDLRRATDAWAEFDVLANTWIQGEIIAYDWQPKLG